MKERVKNQTSLWKNVFKLHWMLLAIFIYSAALVAGNFMILRPQLKQYEQIKQTRAELDEIYLKIRSTDVQSVLDVLKSEAARAGELETIFSDRSVETKDLPVVLSDLNRQAQGVGLQLQYIDFLPERDIIKNRFLKKPITLRFLGTYEQTLAFLNGLEKIPYWLLVDSFIISAPKNQTSALNISLVLYTVMKAT